MMALLMLCEVEPYIWGDIPQPSKEDDPLGHRNWQNNDNHTKHLITQNITDEPLVYIQYGSSSYTAWWNLKAIYENKSQEISVTVIQNPWHTTAEEDDDKISNCTTLKKYWEWFNLVDNNFKIPEVIKSKIAN